MKYLTILSLFLFKPAFLLDAANSISQYGITVYFDADYMIGQFMTGDFWVKPNSEGGTVTIEASDPATTDKSGRIVHGVMQDIEAGWLHDQGFDSWAGDYSSSKNVGDDFPTSFSGGTSLVFSKSRLGIGKSTRPKISDAMALTILPYSATPHPRDFRPPYAGHDKSLHWNADNIDWNVFPDLSPPNRGRNVPRLRSIDGYFSRPWIECNTTGDQQHFMPRNHQPNYGREAAYLINEVALSLCLNYTDEEKERIGLGLVQYGIDIYGAAVDGAEWRSAGGFNHTRKLPMAIAGLVFNDANILAYVDSEAHFIFGEDQQTFFVTQSTVSLGHEAHEGKKWTEAEDHMPATDRDNRRRTAYTVSDIGMPEWGEQHKQQPERDGRNWGVSYRKIVGVGLVGSVLAAEILDLRDRWNHEPLFRYTESRFWPKEEGNRANETNQIHLFEADMWDAYKAYFSR